MNPDDTTIRGQGIGTRITLVSLLASGAVLAIAGLALLLWLRATGEEALQSKAVAMADRFAQALSTPMWNTDAQGSARMAEVEFGDQDVAGILVREGDSGEQVFVCRVRRDGAPTVAEQLPVQDGITIARPVTYDGKVIGRVDLLFDRQRLLQQQRLLTIGTVLAILVVETVLVLVIVLSLRRLVVRPLAETVAVLEAMARGATSQRLSTERSDEIGRLAGAVNRTLDRMAQVLAASTQKADEVAADARGLSGIGTDLRAAADAGRDRAGELAQEAGRLAKNLQSTAAAVTEMDSAIREITRTAADAAAAGGTAATAVKEAERIMEGLAASSDRIGSVVAAIQRISAQTDLLALNATIEAARAGEAGRGFAVVAGEVKALSRQTGEAAGGIIGQIEEVRAGVTAIATQLKAVLAASGRVTEMQHSVAAAVEEQSATTAEITRSIAEVDAGMRAMATSTTAVAEATASTLQAADRTEAAAAQLQQRMDELLRATRGSADA